MKPELIIEKLNKKSILLIYRKAGLLFPQLFLLPIDILSKDDINLIYKCNGLTVGFLYNKDHEDEILDDLEDKILNEWTGYEKSFNFGNEKVNIIAVSMVISLN